MMLDCNECANQDSAATGPTICHTRLTAMADIEFLPLSRLYIKSAGTHCPSAPRLTII